MLNQFLFDRFSEEWAALYRPMQHNPKLNKRFFMIDNWYSMESLVQELEPGQTPSIVLETTLDGRVDDFDRPSYTVYMIAQAANKDGRAALEAKRRAKEAFFAYRNLLAAFKNGDEILNALPFTRGGYLDNLRNAVLNGCSVLQAIDLNVSYDTTGRVMDDWYGVYASFEDCIPYNKCVDYNDYILKEYEEED